MNGTVLMTAALALALPLHGVASEADVEAVKAVVKSAYVDGAHAKLDPALMRAGFHPSFRMLVLKDGALSSVPLADWASDVEKAGAARKGPGPEIRHDFARVDVSGDAATVRLELYRGGKHAYTDYLSLYRFPEGWKIVSKTYYTHPS